MNAAEVLLWLLVVLVALPVVLFGFIGVVMVACTVQVWRHERALARRREQKVADLWARRGAP